MNPNIIYEYSIESVKIILTPIPLIFLLIISIWFLFFYRKKLVMDTIPKFFLLFFSFIMFLFTSIFLVVMFAKIPSAVIKENHVRRIINNKEYSIVEGIVINYDLVESTGQVFEKFEMNGRSFDIYSHSSVYSIFGKRNPTGPYLMDSLQCKVYYFSKNGKNTVVRIEKMD